MWPMVPTFTCGLLRSNFSLAMSSTPLRFYRRCILDSARWLAKMTLVAIRSSEVWSRCPGSNWRPRPYQGRALPTELHRPSPLARITISRLRPGQSPEQSDHLAHGLPERSREQGERLAESGAGDGDRTRDQQLGRL